MLSSYQNRRASSRRRVAGERRFLPPAAPTTIINDYPLKSTKSATVGNPSLTAPLRAASIHDPMRPESCPGRISGCHPAFVIADAFLRHSAPTLNSNKCSSPKDWNGYQPEVDQEIPRDRARRRQPPRLRDPVGYANYPRVADGWDSGGAKTAREISRRESPSYPQWRAWSALIPAIVTSPRSS